MSAEPSVTPEEAPEHALALLAELHREALLRQDIGDRLLREIRAAFDLPP